MLVTVFGLGGTIAMARDQGSGVVPSLSAETLVAAVPPLNDLARVSARSFRQAPGPHLSFVDVESLAREIRRAVVDGAQGVVVTQGTDTIEETSFALDLLLDLDAPVVVTGAMRNPTLPGADGPANVLAAARVALSPEARGLGVLVVLNDEVHAARFVRKAHTSSPSAFVSPGAGPIGWVVEDRVRIVTRPPRLDGVPQREAAADAKVALVTLALDDDGRLVDLARQAGYSGLVVEAMGGGHATPAAADAVERAAAEIPVVLASRAGGGEVLRGTYGFPGAEIDLQRRGALRAGWLGGPKARVLLGLVLRHGASASLARLLAQWGGA